MEHDVAMLYDRIRVAARGMTGGGYLPELPLQPFLEVATPAHLAQKWDVHDARWIRQHEEHEQRAASDDTDAA